MSVQVVPPSVVSNTWPIPAPGPSVKRRLKPFMARNACLGLAGSMPTPPMYRFGTDAGSVTACQLPEALVASPRAKPLLLHGPHQPTYPTPLSIATAVAEWPEPRSKAFAHSERERILKPLSWVQTYWPPAIQCVGSDRSMSNGAMNRGSGSAGPTRHEVAVSVVTAPGFSAQFSVTDIARPVYSWTWRHPSAGSAAASPPSPPKGEPMTVSLFVPFGWTPRRFVVPLSCAPPETMSPPLFLSAPQATE